MPAAQRTHAPATTSWKLPLPHCTQVNVLLLLAYCGTAPRPHVQEASAGEPTNDVEAAGQETQLAPSAAEYVLAWQAWQATAPRPEDDPGEHASQLPLLPRNWPAPHGRQPVWLVKL